MRVRPHLARARALPHRAAWLVLALTGLAATYYAVVLALLAAKADPGTLQAISGYRATYDALAGLHTGQATTTARVLAGVGGLAVALVFGRLAVALVPRPHLTTAPLVLDATPGAAVDVHPRVVERVARIAAVRRPGVRDATASYADGVLRVGLSVLTADAIAPALAAVEQAVAADLAAHDLPALALDVTVVRYRPTTTRELA